MYQIQVSFKDAVMRALTVNYCNFTGRASRSEYWWFCLFGFLLGFVVALVFSFSHTLEMTVSGLVSLALLLPSIGLGVRRLHDTGRSGWWYLLIFIPIIGTLLLLFWFCQESQMQTNEYGPVPNMSA